MSLLIAGVVVLGGLVAARFAGEGGWKDRLALSAVTLGCASVLWVEGHAFLRFALSLLSAVVFARAIGFVIEGTTLTARQRGISLLLICDARRIVQVRPRIDTAKLLGSAAHLLLCALSVGALSHWPLRGPSLGAWALRWTLGVIAIYAFVAVVIGLVETIALAVGWRYPACHRHPILSRSVAEFWSRRWNLVVHRYLWRYAFLPLLRRKRPVLGLAWVFLLSALLHSWYVFVVFRDHALGAAFLVATLAFFNIQAGLILAERRMGLRHWPRPTQHLWAVGAVVLPSPCFTEPMLRIFGL